MNGYWFVLGILVLFFLAGCHRRYLRYRIVRRLSDKGATPTEIAKILENYARVQYDEEV